MSPVIYLDVFAFILAIDNIVEGVDRSSELIKSMLILAVLEKKEPGERLS